MADSYKKLAQVELIAGAAAVSLCTGAAQSTIVKCMTAVNNHATNDTTLAMWHTGTTDQDTILPPTTIDAGGFGNFEGTLVLESTEELYAQAGAGANVTITVYGLEMS